MSNPSQNLKQALEIDPENNEFLLQRSLLYLADGKYDLAINDMSLSLGSKPNDPEILYRRGVAHYLSGSYYKALEDLLASLRNNPFAGYEPDIYYHIGLSHSNLE